MLLPFNYLVSSSSEVSRSPLAEGSLNVLLVLCHYRKCVLVDFKKDKNHNILESLREEETCFLDNPFYKAVENLQDVECKNHIVYLLSVWKPYYFQCYLGFSCPHAVDRIDLEGNAHSGPIVRLPFASLFDSLGLWVSPVPLALHVELNACLILMELAIGCWNPLIGI